MATGKIGTSMPDPIPGFQALDGCHCVTSSLARVYAHSGHPLSEEMLLGLGAGMGFVYWRMRLAGTENVFVGGRGNLKRFYQDLAQRTGVEIVEQQTGSAAKAEAVLLQFLKQGTPVMLGGDMGMLPWFHLPPGYHFGGHTFVACGYDGAETVLASDIDQKAPGFKKGFFAPVSLQQLRKARSSPFKPFPPKNLWLEFDFARFHEPTPEDIWAAIHQCAEAHLDPPIRNLGVSGMRHTARELLKWQDQFNENDLRIHLFNLYVFIEIGGTGGGCFRPMYARFLKEAAEITGNRNLRRASELFAGIGEQFSRVGMLFRKADSMRNLRPAIQTASDGFSRIADQEEAAWQLLKENNPTSLPAI